MNFESLIAKESILRAVNEFGYESPTEIQAKAIPLIKTGVDIIGKSQTGTGKTMAFAIPTVEMIDTNEDKRTVQTLILCPTRELAMQVAEEIKKLIRYTDGIKTAVVYGGASMNEQIMKLKKANIVIGTPGRVQDHLRRKTLKLHNLKSVILDEADEMLSMGFKDDIKTILNEAPDEIQTVLFSATMPQAILDLTEEFQTNPETIEIERKQTTVSTIKQQYVEVPMGRKMDALKIFLHAYSDDIAIIFCNTKKMVDDVEQELNKNGFRALGLHGDMKQEQRTKVMNAYKTGGAKILVATDVAARGIDVYDVGIVINYDVPQNSEYYVHRIGRTGRAGKTGTALTILNGKRQYFDLKDLQRELKITIDKTPLPSLDDIKEIKNERNVNVILDNMDNKVDGMYDQMIDAIIEKGFSERQVAKVLMSLHFGASDNSLNDIQKIKQNHNNDDFAKIKLEVGRKQKIAPNHLVSAIATECGIKGADIGKIEIFDKFSVVAVLKTDLDKVLKIMQNVTIGGHEVNAVLDTKKSFDGGKRGFERRGRSDDRRGKSVRPFRNKKHDN